jgi:NADH-quinone oxidoreductase subunit L
LLYLVMPEWRKVINRSLALPIKVLEHKYWADDVWIKGFAGGSVALGKLSRLFDSKVIDGVAVNGSAATVGLVASVIRKLQSGYLYHYAFAMILGLVALLALANHYWL